MDHKKAVKQLTNEQLFRKLRDEWGYKCGPITVSTRVVYEKKLLNFLNSNKTPKSDSRNGLTPPKKRELASFSDSETEAEPLAPVAVVPRRRSTARRSLPLANVNVPIAHHRKIVTQASPPPTSAATQSSSSSLNWSSFVSSSSNWISLSILIVSIVFFLSLSVFYIYNVYDFKSMASKMRLGAIQAFWYLITIVFIGVITYIILYFTNVFKERANREQKMFYDLLEKVLELLQSPDEPGSMPVLHIRDTLISPLEKKDLSQLKAWARVVTYIEDRESRVQVGHEEIEGETFKTWRWVCPNLDSSLNPSNCTLRTGSIEWQGQAFNERDDASDVNENGDDNSRSSNRKSHSEPFVAPTPFLKVRNMFSDATFKDRNWKSKIVNAIIEKCSLESKNNTHGIYHIFIDDRNAREGLVYVKCADVAAASLAYKALHGWWCQGRLVSVRFLKEDRYNSRFPEAVTKNTPLELVHLPEE